MELAGSARRAVRFGVFEVDFQSGELRKQGVRIRLQEQPFQVLTALLERPGELVTREELVRRLWADGTVVDFDRGLNAAVTRLRQALCDSAEAPRYVETVARRGYRWVAHVEPVGERAVPVPVPVSPVGEHSAGRRSPRVIALCAGIIVLAAVWWFNRARVDSPGMRFTVSPLTTGVGVERNPSFSPDGSQIVYEWLRDDRQRHLYVKVIGPGNPIPLTSGAGAEYGPAWSPDGRLIAFLRQLNETTVGIYVVPPIGGVERKVAESPSPRYVVLRRFHGRLAWTHDSRHLIVSVPERIGAGEGLLLVGIESEEKKWLTQGTQDASSGDREPSVSPDGLMVAFARGYYARQEIYLLPLTSDLSPAGSPRPLRTRIHGQSPAWMPDGKRLVYTSINPGMVFGAEVSMVSLDGSEPAHPLPDLGRNAAVVAVSRAGSIAYSRVVMESNIWRQEIARRGESVPPPVRLLASSATDANAQYSPDGKRIAFASNRSGHIEIWTCGSDGADCIQVTDFKTPSSTGTPRWSPDGKDLVFDSASAGDPAVYIVSASGGVTRRVTDSRLKGVVPSWSHDGAWIYFSSPMTGRSEIWKISPAGGNAVQVTRDGGFVAFDSPNSRTLYYTKNEGKAKLFRSSIDGRDETELFSGVSNRGFSVAADRIYYLREEADGSTCIRQFLFATGKDAQVALLREQPSLGLGLSPDGRYLIYSQLRTASNLMLGEPR